MPRHSPETEKRASERGASEFVGLIISIIRIAGCFGPLRLILLRVDEFAPAFLSHEYMAETLTPQCLAKTLTDEP